MSAIDTNSLFRDIPRYPNQGEERFLNRAILGRPYAASISKIHQPMRSHEVKNRTSTDDIKPLRLKTANKTPYLPDGIFDLEAYDSLVYTQIKDGAPSVIVGGTTVEVQLMRDERIMPMNEAMKEDVFLFTGIPVDNRTASLLKRISICDMLRVYWKANGSLGNVMSKAGDIFNVKPMHVIVADFTIEADDILGGNLAKFLEREGNEYNALLLSLEKQVTIGAVMSKAEDVLNVKRKPPLGCNLAEFLEREGNEYNALLASLEKQVTIGDVMSKAGVVLNVKQKPPLGGDLAKLLEHEGNEHSALHVSLEKQVTIGAVMSKDEDVLNVKQKPPLGGDLAKLLEREGNEYSALLASLEKQVTIGAVMSKAEDVLNVKRKPPLGCGLGKWLERQGTCYPDQICGTISFTRGMLIPSWCSDATRVAVLTRALIGGLY